MMDIYKIVVSFRCCFRIDRLGVAGSNGIITFRASFAVQGPPSRED
jgi:hypothetical protein